MSELFYQRPVLCALCSANTMKLIDKIKYEDTNFKFVSHHWDLHLKGSCIYNNSLCMFITEGYEENESEVFCRIYSLTFKEKIQWWFTQRKFELMVGYHWSYSGKSKRRSFYYRTPKWLYKYFFNLYYKLK